MPSSTYHIEDEIVLVDDETLVVTCASAKLRGKHISEFGYAFKVTHPLLDKIQDKIAVFQEEN